MIRIIAVFLIALFVVLLAQTAMASETETLVVDGVEYTSYKHSGKAFHFNTPDTNPQSAFIVGGHVWVGNGSENLPCPGGIHWIDNKNVLTISHCRDITTTTTTVPTTTSVPSSTTSTVPATTSTTVTTSTSVPSTTTSSPSPTTTTTTPSTTTSTPPGSTTTIPEVVTDVAEKEWESDWRVVFLIFGVTGFIGYKVARKWF